MIDKRWESGEKVFIPVCDGCGEELEPEYDFYEAVETKKHAGWRSVQVYGDWQDYCEDCQEKYADLDFAGIGRP